MEVSEKQLRELDALSEALVFADPTDSESLANINSRVKNIAAWVAGHGLAASETALGHASESMVGVSDKDGERVEAALGFISETVSALQIVIRDGRPESEVTFPDALQSPDSKDSSGAQESLPLTLPAYIDDAIFNEFLARQPGVLDEMESFILDVETDGSSHGLDALRRMLHTLKGESALLGLEEIERLCHTCEDVLDAGDPTEHIDAFLDVKDWMASAFHAYALGVHPAERPDALLEHLETLKSSEAVGSDTEALVVPLEERVNPILDVIEKLDPADMPALASLHTSLEALSLWMETEGSGAETEVASALEAVTKIIFGEVKDAAESLLEVRRILEGVAHAQAEPPHAQAEPPHAQAEAAHPQAEAAEPADAVPYISEKTIDFSTIQDGDLEALEEFASDTETSLESIEI